MLVILLAAVVLGCTAEDRDNIRDQIGSWPGGDTSQPEPELEPEPEQPETEPELEPEPTEPTPEPEPEPEPELEPEPTPEAEAATALEPGEDGRSGRWFAIVAAGVALGAFVAAVTAITRSRKRRAEQVQLLDQALIDADWLLDVSADPPSGSDGSVRVYEIRSRSDRVHDALGRLDSISDTPLRGAALELRDAMSELAAAVIGRIGVPGSAPSLDLRVGELRERVRTMRRGLANHHPDRNRRPVVEEGSHSR